MKHALQRLLSKNNPVVLSSQKAASFTNISANKETDYGLGWYGGGGFDMRGGWPQAVEKANGLLRI